MGRNNLVLKTVFSHLYKTDNKSYEDFLSVDSQLNLSDDGEVNELKQIYRKLAIESEEAIKIVSKIEELIIQLRCRQLIRQNIRLSQVREYIYARSIFYRAEKDIKDIRVVVSKISDVPIFINDLENDEFFINLAVQKLEAAMDIEIEKLRVELLELKTLY